MAGLAAEELKVWCQFIHGLTGIHLDDSKGYLIEGRLGPLLRDTGSGSFGELYYKARAEAGATLKRRVIDAITTNETSFFRDAAPFELLQHKLLPELIDRRTRAGARVVPIRVWSAACSTGQEIYSIAMTLRELLTDRPGYDIRMLGTDISDQAVAYASRGIYTRLEVERGLLPARIARHFVADPGGGWKIRDELRALATFRVQNLLEGFAPPHRFDIVFCRNVAIYFRDAERLRLFRTIREALAPDGVLIIGSTESLTGLCPEFEARRHLRSVYYELKSAGP